ncbi:glycosyltransferase [Cystobacter fuscus]|uniref:glycosyltransferase n=1 Tax=Cystobacter fuscus TaxID=43 RepID=UPI002B283186|nr:glycosyltransferase family 4 protein [Cystobacter fuscus]
MTKILIVLPYSGRDFGGGLAVFNAALTKALKVQGHDVKLLTLELPEKCSPKAEEHGGATLLHIPNATTKAMSDPGGAAGEKDRNTLYDLFNKPEVVCAPSVKELFGAWVPEVIIGHSRFSGPAAIHLKDTFFKSAKVAYFVHSIPVEGSVLAGYEAYEENIDAKVAQAKVKLEQEWMPRADVVVPVGPLIGAGVRYYMPKGHLPAIHECIGGVDVEPTPVPYAASPTLKLLFLGRASAPIKGLEDLLLAALKLRLHDITIDIRYWDDRAYSHGKVTSENVQHFVDGVLGKPETRVIRVNILGKTNDVMAEVKKYHAILMPSYIEHFGLVPFDALACGVPVLANELSGAGMFLSDEAIFGKDGGVFVVKDFDPRLSRPLKPADFLGPVARDAFDHRPQAWADAIENLKTNLQTRFTQANNCYGILKGYKWEHCARAVVAAVLQARPGRFTVQGRDGTLLEKK